jgi:hypothetical protein
MDKRYLFVFYARTDADRVLPVVEAVRNEYRLRSLDIDVWVDITNLAPGQQWADEITSALKSSVGLLVFVSPAAMKSDWVQREIRAAAEHLDRLIIPIILQQVRDLPIDLARRQWLDLSDPRQQDIQGAAKAIADATERHINVEYPSPPISPGEAPALAAVVAKQAREASLPSAAWDSRSPERRCG